MSCFGHLLYKQLENRHAESEAERQRLKSLVDQYETRNETRMSQIQNLQNNLQQEQEQHNHFEQKARELEGEKASLKAQLHEEELLNKRSSE